MSDERIDVTITADTTRFEEGIEAAAHAVLHAVTFNAITTGLAHAGRFVTLKEREDITARVIEAIGERPALTDWQVRAYLDRNPAAFADLVVREMRRRPGWLMQFFRDQDRIRGIAWRSR